MFKSFQEYFDGEVISSVEDFVNGLSARITSRDKVIALYKDLFECAKKGAGAEYDVDTMNVHGLTKKKALELINGKILEVSPGLLSVMINFHPKAAHQLSEAEFSKESPIQFDNIMDYKIYLRKGHNYRWRRPLNDNEKQGSVSILGSISEQLLAKALGKLVDGVNLLRTTRADTKSYGDFVLMGLPNNLWFSVKSGFSRERLLASGFSNDLIGVGFFESSQEFSSLNKVRNFKKVGFLAIYLPDSPVTEAQLVSESSTFKEVEKMYGETPPLNINGTKFFRPLSSLGTDIKELMDRPISGRSIIEF